MSAWKTFNGGAFNAFTTCKQFWWYLFPLIFEETIESQDGFGDLQVFNETV